jgi:hypothetical protein
MKPMRHGAMRRGVSSETTGAMSLRTCRSSSFRARARGYQARCRVFGKDQTELNEVEEGFVHQRGLDALAAALWRCLGKHR